MIGHEIEYLAETTLAKRLDHVPERRFTSEFRVKLAVIDDVVPVSAAGPGLQIRRSVNVADAKPRQIGCDRASIPKPEPFMELQPVGRPRDWWTAALSHAYSRR